MRGLEKQFLQAADTLTVYMSTPGPWLMRDDVFPQPLLGSVTNDALGEYLMAGKHSLSVIRENKLESYGHNHSSFLVKKKNKMRKLQNPKTQHKALWTMNSQGIQKTIKIVGL